MQGGPPKPIGESVDVLYFSRGKGRGHAIPDLAIATELRKLRPELRLVFASYGVGAEMLASAGETTIDLGLDGTLLFFDVLVSAGALLQRLRPRRVVSHEDSAVLPIAKVFGLPTSFLIHWFSGPHDPFMQALRYADEILFIEKAGMFPEPDYVKGRIRYLGPVLRHFHYRPADRDRVRAELGIAADESVVLVLPKGELSHKSNAPYDVIVEAFQQLPKARKRLLWVADKDPEEIAKRALSCPGIEVLPVNGQPERLMVACNVAITKGTYSTGKELEALGVPSISLSDGRNPIDEYYLRGFTNNTCVWLQDADASTLARHIERTIDRGPFPPDLNALEGSGAAAVAQCLAAGLDQTPARIAPSVH
jgi:hypothetical protein